MKKLLIIFLLPGIFIILLIQLFSLRQLNKEKKSYGDRTVYIKESESGFQLIRNGKPFFIKGASGNSYLKELAEAGGNTIRVYDTLNLENILNEAQKNNLAVIVDIYIPRFQIKYNPYSKKEDNDLLEANILKFVNKYKSHPAILFWNLGNELDYPSILQKSHAIPSIDDLITIFHIIVERNSFIKTFNELIDIVHKEDPNHPVSTSLSTHHFWKRLLSVHIHSPNLDLIGYNIFAPAVKFKPQLSNLSHIIALNPFFISEWGIEGPWAQEKTLWNAPVETTSTNKGYQYRENYAAIVNQFNLSIGAAVFYWGKKQERTHTWFNIFDEQGKKSQAYYELKNIWKNELNSSNLPPQVKYMLVNNLGARDNLVFKPNEIINAQLLFENEIDSTIKVNWEIYEEEWNYEGGGAEHKIANKIFDSIEKTDTAKIAFRIPVLEGPYRIFAFVYDQKGNFATANTPFYVLDSK